MSFRSQQPETKQVDHISFVKPQIFDITQDVKLLWMQEVPNETVRLDLFFDAGITRGGKSIPAIVHSLLLSGTNELSSVEIHEKIDSLGGFLDTDISFETAVVSIYCLREHIRPISNIVANAIQELSFRDNEVEDVLRSMKQQYAVNQQKVKYVAQQQFRKQLFASNTDYSTISEESDYDDISLFSFKKFWKEHYLNGLTRMTLVGNLELDDVDALIDLFGKWAVDSKVNYANGFEFQAQRLDFPKDGAVQCALRMGRFLFHKSSPDYIDFQVLNTILGDYFGSRLMSNIREDKGYTYGIGTGVMDMNETGYFVIVTEVGKEVLDKTLHEIKFELERLQTELVPEDELNLVKNYMLGQLLKSADGPYAMLDMYNSVDMYNLDLSFYDDAIQKVKNITAVRIQELAKQYLNFEDFLIITAG
ncbi:M16 family metallopeptidase [Fluviicola taffensis]|uniref:Peptidase M16 domain protein n=1 Tax=Fluviicola taffensis (strain DSM 16823 / NCIMB 13979 / RW262) TaxID=755732 RepID=F2IE75_FLUTR|nr:pitrilysin family protein [Fluviicola taffensis]AEA42393.1 peptidase M16 domain protein [Fluviicola taffensis DSM 16823]